MTNEDLPSCQCAPSVMDPDIHGFCQYCGLRIGLPIRTRDMSKCDDDTDLGMVSDIGQHHEINQDAGLVGRTATGTILMAVADGVSSSDKADIASSTAVMTAYKEIEAASYREIGQNVVFRAIAVAHAAVKAIPRSNPLMEEPETTIVVAMVRGPKATIAWVGDSRIYTISRAHARLNTRDDSWLADMIDSGAMPLEEALADRRSHAITQCLGMQGGEIRVHVREIDISAETWLLACTDGLWNYFDHPAAMAAAVADAPPDSDAFELCQHLVKLANQAGGYDNITVAAYRCNNRAPTANQKAGS